MASLVRELQKDALDSTILVSSLLRKALVVARKLSIADFRKWCENELNGYQTVSEIPKYRFVSCELMADNPYHGLIPVIQRSEMADIFSNKAIGQPVAELEDVRKTKKDNGFLIVPIPKNIEASLVSMLEGLYPVVVVDKSEINGILDSVRNIILDWSLKLEERGILGEDMTFSEQEKKAVPSITYNIGQMLNSQIQHGTSNSKQSISSEGIKLDELIKFVNSLRESIKDLKLQKDKESEFESEIMTIEAQTKSPKPKTSIIRESLISIKNILEGAAGSIIAAKLLEYLPAILASMRIQ